MQLAWVTDPHLEWLNETADKFLLSLVESQTDDIVISGDISNAKQLKGYLERLNTLPMPVYFVLGNHDFYGSSFEYVGTMVRRTLKNCKNLVWLTESDPIQLTPQTYLIGHDGWADGRAGAGQRSGYLINDYKAISDFQGLSIGSVFSLIQKRADTAARRLETQIRQIGSKHVLLITHAPPFERACLFQGSATSPMYLPHFSNIGLGRTLLVAAERTKSRISVLCGHTHEENHITVGDRIGVWVGGAVVGNPTYTTIDVDLGC